MVFVSISANAELLTVTAEVQQKSGW